MLRFIGYLQFTPKLKSQVKKTSIISLGLFLGYLKGVVVNQKYENINDSKLTIYQNEDQLNSLIQENKKPAVIYYYFPLGRDHSFFRQMMFKYSNKYPQNAIWSMINLTKKFQQAKSTFDFQYPTRMMIEVRFPKSNIAIKVGDEGQFIQLQQKGNRREGFKYSFDEQSFKKFLEENRVIQGKDPVKSLLNVTNKALFHSIQQKRQV